MGLFVKGLLTAKLPRFPEKFHFATSNFISFETIEAKK